VYQFLGNVNVLRAQALALAGAHSTGTAAALEADGQVYVRPHDIEVVRDEPGAAGIVAVLRHVHSAGPQARLALEQVQNREPIDVEISRTELVSLDLKVNDLVRLRLRQGHSFADDYAI
jgi:sulfate transport system ATP-binding protein